MENCSKIFCSSCTGLANLYIFLFVILIDYISNVIPLPNFPSSALSGINGREGPWSCGGLTAQHRIKLGWCGRVYGCVWEIPHKSMGRGKGIVCPRFSSKLRKNSLYCKCIMQHTFPYSSKNSFLIYPTCFIYTTQFSIFYL